MAVKYQSNYKRKFDNKDCFLMEINFVENDIVLCFHALPIKEARFVGDEFARMCFCDSFSTGFESVDGYTTLTLKNADFMYFDPKTLWERCDDFLSEHNYKVNNCLKN